MFDPQRVACFFDFRASQPPSPLGPARPDETGENGLSQLGAKALKQVILLLFSAFARVRNRTDGRFRAELNPGAGQRSSGKASVYL